VPGLHLADSLWANAAVRPEFAEELCCLFAAEVRPLAGKDVINCYIKDHTHGLIPSLLAQDPDNTVLLNVLSIQFEWFREFPQENSINNTLFYGLAGESRCRMMNPKGPSLLPVSRFGTCIAVLVQYANGAENNIDTELVTEEQLCSQRSSCFPTTSAHPRSSKQSMKRSPTSRPPAHACRPSVCSSPSPPSASRRAPCPSAEISSPLGSRRASPPPSASSA
jgi:hypothetical protein